MSYPTFLFNRHLLASAVTFMHAFVMIDASKLVTVVVIMKAYACNLQSDLVSTCKPFIYV